MIELQKLCVPGPYKRSRFALFPFTQSWLTFLQSNLSLFCTLTQFFFWKSSKNGSYFAPLDALSSLMFSSTIAFLSLKKFSINKGDYRRAQVEGSQGRVLFEGLRTNGLRLGALNIVRAFAHVFPKLFVTWKFCSKLHLVAIKYYRPFCSRLLVGQSMLGSFSLRAVLSQWTYSRLSWPVYTISSSLFLPDCRL